MIAFYTGGITVQANLYSLLQQTNIGDSTLSVTGIDNGILLGTGFDQGFIGILLIFQAAHKPPAGAGNFGGVQRKTLSLCHFDGNRLKVIQKLLAAEGTATDAKSTHHFCLVSYTNLAQLNAGTEHTSKVFDEVTEIYPAICCEIKENLTAVKVVFGRNQLHIQLMIRYFCLTNLKGMCFVIFILLTSFTVILRCDPDDRTKGLNDLVSGNRMIAFRTEPIFCTFGCIDNDLVARGNFQLAGIKIIHLPTFLELNAHNGNVLGLRNGVKPYHGGLIVQRNIAECHHRSLYLVCGGIRKVVHLVTPFC